MAAKRKSIATRWFINSFGIIAVIMLVVIVGVYFFPVIIITALSAVTCAPKPV